MSAIYVEIIAARGSTPRDVGAAMKVSAGGAEGTIGGGALEYRASAEARRMLSSGETEQDVTWPLGPGLGQCCGGAVTLRFGRVARHLDPVAPPLHIPRQAFGNLWIWGAGHVGRAVVQACPPTEITWIDTDRRRFPSHIPHHVRIVPASDMPLLAARSPREAHHLIFTYSHDIDLGLCAALLKRDPKSIGLIGSDTKWARFRSRLTAMGLDPSGITCPIGDKRLGKRPDQIARGVVEALLAQEPA